jgi:uncharacterized protein (DUF433 family)
MPSLDWSQCPGVESDPDKLGGAYCFRGTRVPISTVFENLVAGATIDNIVEWFQGITTQQVKAVLDFAACSSRPKANSHR